MDDGHAARCDSRCCRPPRSTSSRRRTAKTRLLAARSPSSRRPSRWPCRTRRPCASATTSASSRPSAPCWPRARRSERKTDEDLDHAIRQIVSKADRVRRGHRHLRRRRPEEAGHLDPLRRVPGRSARHAATNLAVELLRKLLNGEIKTRSQANVVQARSFAELLEQAIRRYQNRAIETAQVIEELIELAKEMREANARGEELGLTDDELAFYDALETNDSAVKVLGDDDPARPSPASWWRPSAQNVTIDWTVRENVRAQLRVLVKRILRKHGYPPDKQEKATQTVLEQAEVLSEEWAVA